MSGTTAGLLQIGALLTALALCYRPLGGCMARVFTSKRDLRVERFVYRVVGVDPRADQRWSVYAASLIAFSFVSVVGLYALQRFQSDLPWSLGFAGVDPALAFNTAASFVTNTNWQAYSGESTMGHPGGTKVLSDRIVVEITAMPGESFIDRMIALVEGPADRRRPTRSRSTSCLQV